MMLSRSFFPAFSISTKAKATFLGDFLQQKSCAELWQNNKKTMNEEEWK
jgi:hypothetical protein